MNSTDSRLDDLNLTTNEIIYKLTDSTTDMVDVAKTIHWYTSVFGTLFLVVGLIGNVLSIIVWNRKSIKSSTGTYLTAQAVTDIGLLVSFFLTDSLPTMVPDIKNQYVYGVFYSYVGFPAFYLAFAVSVWMLVGVTVDRYIQVCWISLSRTMATERRAVYVIGLIVTLCFVVNVPHVFNYHPISSRNQTDVAFELTEYGKGSGSQLYEFLVHCMLLVLIPWFSILFMNIMIIRSVWKTAAKMNGKKNVYAQEKTKRPNNQLTYTLLTVTFTFLVLIALQCITQCFFMLKPDTINFELVAEAFSVSTLGVIINSSINVFLYCLSGRRFRQELLKVMGCHTADEASSSQQISSPTARSTPAA